MSSALTDHGYLPVRKYFAGGNFSSTVKPVYNGHPWDPKIVAIVPLFRGLSIKIAIKIDLAGFKLGVVHR